MKRSTLFVSWVNLSRLLLMFPGVGISPCSQSRLMNWRAVMNMVWAVAGAQRFSATAPARYAQYASSFAAVIVPMSSASPAHFANVWAWRA